MGGGELLSITDEAAQHKNVSFPEHEHATLYSSMYVEPKVRGLLTEKGVQLNFCHRIVDVVTCGRTVESVVTADMAKITDTLFAHCNDTGFHGSERNLFVSSITPFGTLSHLETFLSPETTIIGLVGEHGAGRSKIINHAAEIARVKGIKVEICHNPLDRNYMEHLFLPEPNLVLTAKPHEFPEQNPYIYDLNECLAPWVKEKTRELAEEKANSGYLLDKAVETLHAAKLTHERIEQFYIPNMDFSRMDNYRKSIENRILNHAAQFNPGLGR